MTSINQNGIQAKRLRQNNQEFLIGSFQISQILKFTRYTEHLIVSYEEIEEDKIFENRIQIKPIYNPEIQRKTNAGKIDRIADFLIYDPAAMFPTNIVIAIPNQVIDEIVEVDGIVNITLNEIVLQELNKKDGAVFLTIIDGQHRIRGVEKAIDRIKQDILDITKTLSKSPENPELIFKLNSNQKILNRLLNFELLVTFFIDPTLEYQAMIFATINKTQTKVPENLVYSLFGLTKDDSPQKTSLEVVLALNGIEKSPFFNRIRLVGDSYKRGESVPLSQATMVTSILKNISNNLREAEIDRFKKRETLKPNPKNLAFRKYYAYDNDRMIVRILYSFFSAVRDIYQNKEGVSFWILPSNGKVQNVLQTNVGYQAMLKILFDLLDVIPEDKKDDKEGYYEYLSKAVDINWADDGEDKRYPFTSATINVLYDDVKKKIFK